MTDKILNSTIYKRIGTESVELIKKNRVVSYYSDETCKHMTVIVETYNNTICKFILNNRFPFRPPESFINDIPFHTYVKVPKVYIYYMKLIFNKECFCCDSSLCENNWSPAKRLWEIVDEIEIIKKKKRELLYIYYCDIISNKYLTHDLNLYQYF